MSDSGKVDHKVKRWSYFLQIKLFVFEPYLNRSEFRICDRWDAVMDSRPNLGVFCLWQQGPQNPFSQGRGGSREKQCHGSGKTIIGALLR